MFAVQADGHEIVTVEGLTSGRDGLNPAAAGDAREARPAVRLLHAGHP